ncbi:MAG TPA: hypothetical protein VFQ35_04155 [Polyangiaceae bacterium]|nr:hypothetical protein [Polyangiaceae bacterium]
MGPGSSSAGWRRHLEGWELGLLAVVFAMLAVWLALPRPVEPRLVPLPEVDRRVLARSVALDVERAVRAHERPLAYEVRALGEFVRRHGAAVARHDTGAATEARDEARRLCRSLAARGLFEELQVLRATQTRLFLDAVERFRQGEKDDRELSELGANFVERGQRSGWLDADGRVLLSTEELRALYRMRWAELTGALEIGRLRPSLDEFRLYYRVLLEHPEGLSPPEQDERRLAYVTALARIDSEFPTDLARGVLLARLGRVRSAYDAFSAFVVSHEQGPWVLRARNYALWALAQASPTE